jgi:hypothetical protein
MRTPDPDQDDVVQQLMHGLYADFKSLVNEFLGPSSGNPWGT